MEDLQASVRLAEATAEIEMSTNDLRDPDQEWRRAGATRGIARISWRESTFDVQESAAGGSPEGEQILEPFLDIPLLGDSDWETEHPSPLENLPRPKSIWSKRQRRRNPSPRWRQPLLE